jgi:ankyrin repeat protein
MFYFQYFGLLPQGSIFSGVPTTAAILSVPTDAGPNIPMMINLQIVDILLHVQQLTIDANTSDKYGQTASSRASVYGHIETIQLLRAHADIDLALTPTHDGTLQECNEVRSIRCSSCVLPFCSSSDYPDTAQTKN